MKTEKLQLIKQGWIRAMLYGFVIVCAVIGVQLATPFLLNLYKDATGSEAKSLAEFIINYVAISVVIFTITLLFRQFVDRKSFASLGFEWRGFANEKLLGFFTGPALLGIGTIILVALGYLTFIGFTFDPQPLLMELLILILVAFTEELLFRGYLLNNLMQSMNKWAALTVSAVLFGLFHAANPGVSFLAVINVLLAGFLLGINYIYTKNLWFGIFFHFSWNFFQGPILGYDVSGLGLQSLFQQTLDGPALYTGGPFGFEGSLICPVLIAVATAYFAFTFSKMYKREVAFDELKN